MPIRSHDDLLEKPQAELTESIGELTGRAGIASAEHVVGGRYQAAAQILDDMSLDSESEARAAASLPTGRLGINFRTQYFGS